MKNMLIIIEGADGAGKSIMVKDLQNEILKRYKHIKVKSLSLPHTSSFAYKKIREVLQDPDRYPPDILQSLFIANMIECAENVINPFFEESNENHILFLDRSLISTIIYNVTSGGTIFNSMLQYTYKTANEIVPFSMTPTILDLDITLKVYSHIIQPAEFTFFLMPPVDILIKHAQERESTEENDKIASVIRRYESYKTLYYFLTGRLHRNVIEFLESPMGVLVPNINKFNKYIELSDWSPDKTEEQNYASLREEVLARLNIT